MRVWLLLVAGCASQSAVQRQVGQGMAGYETRARKSDLSLNCDPTDAEVWLNGVPHGTCRDFSGHPNALKLGEGMHRVEVKKPGFWPYETQLDSGGTRAILTVKLLPKP